MSYMRHKPRKRGRLSGAPRSRTGKFAVLAVAAGAMGYICARLIVLLADVRPYLGWYWLLAVTGGIAVAVGIPWACMRGFRGSARWPQWLLIGYIVAVAGGMRYYMSLRFTPPGHVPAALPPPPLRLVLQVAGMSAVALTFLVFTLLIVAVTVEVIAPGPVGRWLGALRARRPTVAEQSGPLDERFPTRLRLFDASGRAGRWLRGAIQVRPGSLLWEPAMGVSAAPAELTAATVAPAPDGRAARKGQAVTIDLPTGRAQLECDAAMFTLLQQVAEAPGGQQPQATADER